MALPDEFLEEDGQPLLTEEATEENEMTPGLSGGREVVAVPDKK